MNTQPIAHCFRTIRMLLLAIASTFTTPSVLARDASPDQCTCNIPGQNKKTGAQVVNASSCVLEARYPWCDIYLASTENSKKHRVIVGSLNEAAAESDREKLKALLLDMFDRYVESTARNRDIGQEQYNSDRQMIDSILNEDFEQIRTCINAFNSNEPTERGSRTSHCYVGNQSRWLRIAIKSEGKDHYIFVFAPVR
ncbi:MAG: hypothetical protein H6954_05210 [Chromatiaceae bacterium]|nr:hypothetical protein [Chromatiaceae bacterium]